MDLQNDDRDIQTLHFHQFSAYLRFVASDPLCFITIHFPWTPDSDSEIWKTQCTLTPAPTSPPTTTMTPKSNPWLERSILLPNVNYYFSVDNVFSVFQGIKHLCSELLELKAASNEEFQRNIFSNYSAFVR
ncbi:exocyst complex component EXO84B-like [Fagus crenata]